MQSFGANRGENTAWNVYIHRVTPRCTPGLSCDPITFSRDGKAVSQREIRWALGNTLNNGEHTFTELQPPPASLQHNPQGMCSVKAEETPEININTPQTSPESSTHPPVQPWAHPTATFVLPRVPLSPLTGGWSATSISWVSLSRQGTHKGHTGTLAQPRKAPSGWQQHSSCWRHCEYSPEKMQKTPCHTKHNPCTPHCGAGRTANPWGSSPSSIHSGTMCSSASGKQQHTKGKHRAEFAEPAASLGHPLEHCLQCPGRAHYKCSPWKTRMDCKYISLIQGEMPEVTDVKCSLFLQGRWGAQKEFDVHFKGKEFVQSGRQFCVSLGNEFLLKKSCHTEICLTERLFYSFCY